ncbi:MAG TPA: DUF2723 domain-containing protein [Microthrixaceae bacterium]|nr:DUF2723 domain-containing protein [Microthrixaceae bacterium]
MPTTPKRVPPRWHDPLLVGVVAVIVRFTWVGFMSRTPKGLSDPVIYLAAARSIASGHGYRTITGTPTSYYPPGYPFFLGAIQWFVNLVGLDSHFVLIVGLIQAVLGAFTAALVVVIGRRLVAPTHRARLVGLTGGLIVAFWPNLIAHSSLLLSETLFIAVFTLLAALIIKSLLGDARRLDLLVSAALLMGIATLIRPQSALLLIPAVAIAMLVARQGIRQASVHIGALCLGVVLVVTPWTIRNSEVLGGPVFVSTNTGDNLCIGFNPDAEGGFAMPPRCQTETSYTDGPTEERLRDSELRDRAMDWALGHPMSLPGLGISKIIITFQSDHDAIRAVESFGEDPFLGDRTRSVLNGMADTYYFIVLTLALVGLVGSFARRSSRQGLLGGQGAARLTVVLVVLAGALIPVLSFGEPRFKVPLEPFLALLAAVAVGEFAMMRSGRYPSEEPQELHQFQEGAAAPNSTDDQRVVP